MSEREEALRRDLTDMQRVIAILLGKLGGTALISARELMEFDGRTSLVRTDAQSGDGFRLAVVPPRKIILAAVSGNRLSLTDKK
jgi:hypothetical protein